MKMLRFVRCLGELLALVAPAMAAQTSVTNWSIVQALARGTQVRIVAGSRTVAGKIERSTDDALVVTSGKNQETFGRQQVSILSVKKASHRTRNALIGLAAGTGIGLAIGLAARSKPGQLEIVPNSAVTAGFTVAGALLGTVVGVIIPTSGWREIYRK
jgi:hypothetical protein